jgi:subtilase family serine protease
MPRKPRRRSVPITVAAASTLLAGLAGAPGANAAAPATPSVPPFNISVGPNFTLLPAPLTTSQCLAAYGISCYSANQLQDAYNVGPLLRRGIDGRGETIVELIPYGSPTLQHDLDVYDRQFGLPDTKVQIIKFGKLPAFDPTNFLMVESAAGITWQVELAHTMAPAAKIVVAEVNVSDPSAPDAGIAECMQAERQLVDEGIGDIFEQMFSTAEGTFPGASTGDYSSILQMRGALQDAEEHHVTTTTPAGDFGVTEYDAEGNLYTEPAVLWPATDPLVTAVGGDELYLDDAGDTIAPPTGWNNFGGAGAGGLSEVFKAPAYQAEVSSVVGDQRGIPDISGSASVDGGSWIYTSFNASAWGGSAAAGWNIFDATGGATAMFSGVMALADQLAGHRLGLINPALYRLGYLSEHGDPDTGIVPITEGNNSLGGVTGYSAGPGYNLDTGWGTIDAAAFVPALVDEIDH